MLKHLLLYVICLYLLPKNGNGQDETDYKEVFLEAESYFLFEEYREALPLYTKLINNFPDNYNFHYRIGVCYLNISYRKSSSIEHLEKAVQNITSDYKEGSFKETMAPLEAYYYLANAYRINNQLEKAIETYKKFKQLIDVDIYNSELVDEQIRATENALKLEKRPIDFNYENLGERINSRFADVKPVISGDETKMAFVAELQFYDAVFYSEKAEGEWSYPRNLIPEFGVDGDVYTTSLSYDGKEMYLYRSDNFIGNLYVSNYKDGTWSTLKKLNDNINTKYWESHASTTKDGSALYFSSNRKGGYGGLDIYRSKRQLNGEWGPAENLGSTVNTKYNDDTPFITEDNTLYFSSFGHYSMGGYDVFYSNMLNENRWSVPVNLGYPINTTDDDQFFQPVKNGIYAYYSFYKSNNFGRHDIYKLEIFSDQHPRKFEIAGIINVKDNVKPTKSFKVTLVSSSKKDTLDMVYSDETGNYKLLAPVGSYKIIIDEPGFEKLEQNLVITKKNKNVAINTELVPLAEEPPVMTTLMDTVQNIRIDKTYFEVNSDEELTIKMQLEKGSKLYVETYNDNQLTNAEEFDITKKRFNYQFTPLPGRSIILFKLLDTDGNISIQKVVVDCKPGKHQEVFALDSSLMEYYNQLLRLAEGDLKQTLADINLEESDIRTIDELITYLIEQAKYNNYTEDDVKNLIRKLNDYLELQEFHKMLIILADGELKEVLQHMNLTTLGITSPLELVQYLIHESVNYNYSNKDVYSLLLELANSNINNIEILIDKLIANAPDSISKTIAHLKDRNIVTIDELGNELASLVENGSIKETALLKLLLDVSLDTDQDVNELLALLKAIAIGNLKLYVDNLDLETQNIHSISALINHLKYQAPFQDYSAKELMAIITAISYSGNLENYLTKLSILAMGELKKTLQTYSLVDNKITSAASLIIDLKKKSTADHYTEQDVIDLLLKYYEHLSTEDFLNTLILLADDELKAFLKGINLTADQISGISALIDFLEEHAKQNAYSVNGLIKLLIGYLPDDNLENFIKVLTQLADKDLKKFIKNIDLEKENIITITDLFNYLLHATKNNEFTEQDVMDLFIEALKHLLDPNNRDERSGINNNFVKYSLGVLALIGLLIIIFIRRNKKKRE